MLKGWRTLVFNSAVAVVGVLQASGLHEVLPPQYVAPAMAVVGLVNIWLRSMTNTPMGVK